eukprot:TRINITY_DN6549_c8_g1_i1.p1 TRINITY_DN6549_c8_g1~~TRINITY_DN6549_c8_g1_i1.p1  ORF type:complete len:1021 (+),score=331.66 TRINITY_DN6549_c8_g1_i1:109-3171(+)
MMLRLPAAAPVPPGAAAAAPPSLRGSTLRSQRRRRHAAGLPPPERPVGRQGFATAAAEQRAGADYERLYRTLTMRAEQDAWQPAAKLGPTSSMPLLGLPADPLAHRLATIAQRFGTGSSLDIAELVEKERRRRHLLAETRARAAERARAAAERRERILAERREREAEARRALEEERARREQERRLRQEGDERRRAEAAAAAPLTTEEPVAAAPVGATPEEIAAAKAAEDQRRKAALEELLQRRKEIEERDKQRRDEDRAAREATRRRLEEAREQGLAAHRPQDDWRAQPAAGEGYVEDHTPAFAQQPQAEDPGPMFATVPELPPPEAAAVPPLAPEQPEPAEEAQDAAAAPAAAGPGLFQAPADFGDTGAATTGRPKGRPVRGNELFRDQALERGMITQDATRSAVSDLADQGLIEHATAGTEIDLNGGPSMDLLKFSTVLGSPSRVAPRRQDGISLSTEHRELGAPPPPREAPGDGLIEHFQFSMEAIAKAKRSQPIRAQVDYTDMLERVLSGERVVPKLDRFEKTRNFPGTAVSLGDLIRNENSRYSDEELSQMMSLVVLKIQRSVRSAERNQVQVDFAQLYDAFRQALSRKLSTGERQHQVGVRSFTVFFNACGHAGAAEEALAMYKTLLANDVEPNSRTMSRLVIALGTCVRNQKMGFDRKVELAREALQRLDEMYNNFYKDSLDLGLLDEEGHIGPAADESGQIFLSQVCVSQFNALGGTQQRESAEQLWKRMVTDFRLRPNQYTYTAYAKCLIDCGATEAASRVIDEFRAVAHRGGPDIEPRTVQVSLQILFTQLILHHAVNAQPAAAETAFSLMQQTQDAAGRELMRVTPNVQIYTALMRAHCNAASYPPAEGEDEEAAAARADAQMRGARSVLRRMLHSGVKPNAHTWAQVLWLLSSRLGPKGQPLPPRLQLACDYAFDRALCVGPKGQRRLRPDLASPEYNRLCVQFTRIWESTRNIARFEQFEHMLRASNLQGSMGKLVIDALGNLRRAKFMMAMEEMDQRKRMQAELPG